MPGYNHLRWDVSIGQTAGGVPEFEFSRLCLFLHGRYVIMIDVRGIDFGGFWRRANVTDSELKVSLCHLSFRGNLERGTVAWIFEIFRNGSFEF